MSGKPRTIAIIGAGFCGTTVATNLLSQQHGGERLRILLFDRAIIARGTAYADRGYPYLLNVPAGRMSSNSAAPLEFLHFARDRFPEATAEDFLPRALYGEYLEWKLRSAQLSAPSQLELVRVYGEVRALRAYRSASTFKLQLTDGRAFAVDEVILAVGNSPPPEVPGIAAVLGTERYVEDPWNKPATFDAGDTVLILGTGLTMADITLAAAAATQGKIVIHALSRHGWLPAPQNVFPSTDRSADGELLIAAAGVSARRLCRAVRGLVASVQAKGGDWRDAINCVRHCAPAIWQRLAIDERRRFLRHLRTLWEVHRHRLPHRSFAALNQLRAVGALRVHAGRLLDCELRDGQIRVTWRRRGSDDTSRLTVDRIINCTGTGHNLRRLRDPLWCSLLSQGMVCADPLGLGLSTGVHGAVVDARGQIVDHLYYVGPMLQAKYWESTAVLELRQHAEDLASHLMASGGQAQGRADVSRQFRPVARLSSPALDRNQL
jgi:uncharacterized NAD(P)/FAD-binding protein YdhS